MILKQIKITGMGNSKAETLTEILVSTVIAVLIFISAIGTFLIIRNVQNYSIAEYNLQRDVNVIINRVMRSITEDVSSHGLRSGSSFTIPGSSEINYMSPDGRLRKYFQSGNTIVYQSPAQWPNQRTILTAPAGGTLILRFWEPPGYLGHETVGIYIAVSRQVGNRVVSGSASTYINIRNLPK